MKEKKFYDTPEFLELKKKWDAKLAKSGFTDVEMYDSEGRSGNLLKGYSAMDAVRFYDQEAADYFYRAVQHYNWRVFKRNPYNPIEAAMWRTHARGRPMTEVAAAGQCSIKKAKAYVAEEKRRMFMADARIAPEDIPLLGSKEFQIKEEFHDVSRTPKGKTKRELSDE